MDDDKTPKSWLKRIAVAVAVLALVGLGLYYTVKFSTYSPEAHQTTAPPPDTSWGISKDSPIRNKR